MDKIIQLHLIDTEHEHLILHLQQGDDPEPYTGMSFWVRVEVRVASFTADVENYIFTDELQNFQRELEIIYATLSGKASLTTTREWLTIEIKTLKLGGICISGSVKQTIAGITKGSMLFQFEDTDQTYLQNIIKQFKHAISVFKP